MLTENPKINARLSDYEKERNPTVAVCRLKTDARFLARQHNEGGWPNRAHVRFNPTATARYGLPKRYDVVLDDRDGTPPNYRPQV